MLGRRKKEDKMNAAISSRFVLRGKHHNKTETKTTVSLYLSKILVEKAKNHKINLSRIAEQALNSILEYPNSKSNRKL